MNALDGVKPIDELIALFRQEFGEGGVLTGPDLEARNCDPFTHSPPRSPAILRPRTTAEVARIMALCHASGQPVVMHGGRTGVAGGAQAAADELVVSLERMNRIIEVDPVGGTMTVEAGVAIETVQQEAERHGLFYPIDLGSKGSATVGGTIATNAGGNRVLRWGMTRQNVLGLEVVIADGTVLDLQNRFLKNNTGYDLKQLFIGSEGTLGIVCSAVLRIVPRPRTQKVALVSLDAYSKVLDLLRRARAIQQLSAFEVMWQDYCDIVCVDPARRLLDPAAGFFVLIEMMGNDEAADETAFSGLLEEAFSDGLLVDAVLATSNKQAEALWRVREASDILVREMHPFVSFDISVNIGRADAFVAAVRAALARRFDQFRTVAFGHLGDSNIHIGVHIGSDTLARSYEVEVCVYAVVREFGGALTAEHGVGTAKRDFLPNHVTPASLLTMRQVRQALDPFELLNRNVLFLP